MVSVVAPGLVLRSTLNAREHWAVRHRRNREHKDAVLLALFRTKKPAKGAALVVTFTRLYCGRAKAMDSDNLAASCKAARDAVAMWLGRDDNEAAGIEWRYQQRRGDLNAVEIRIEEVAA